VKYRSKRTQTKSLKEPINVQNVKRFHIAEEHLILHGYGVAAECAVILAKLKDVPRDLPHYGLHVGAAYAFEVAAELLEVHAVDHLICLRPLAAAHWLAGVQHSFDQESPSIYLFTKNEKLGSYLSMENPTDKT